MDEYYTSFCRSGSLIPAPPSSNTDTSPSPTARGHATRDPESLNLTQFFPDPNLSEGCTDPKRRELYEYIADVWFHAQDCGRIKVELQPGVRTTAQVFASIIGNPELIGAVHDRSTAKSIVKSIQERMIDSNGYATPLPPLRSPLDVNILEWWHRLECINQSLTAASKKINAPDSRTPAPTSTSAACHSTPIPAVNSELRRWKTPRVRRSITMHFASTPELSMHTIQSSDSTPTPSPVIDPKQYMLDSALRQDRKPPCDDQLTKHSTPDNTTSTTWTYRDTISSSSEYNTISGSSYETFLPDNTPITDPSDAVYADDEHTSSVSKDKTVSVGRIESSMEIDQDTTTPASNDDADEEPSGILDARIGGLYCDSPLRNIVDADDSFNSHIIDPKPCSTSEISASASYYYNRPEPVAHSTMMQIEERLKRSQSANLHKSSSNSSVKHGASRLDRTYVLDTPAAAPTGVPDIDQTAEDPDVHASANTASLDVSFTEDQTTDHLLPAQPATRSTSAAHVMSLGRFVTVRSRLRKFGRRIRDGDCAPGCGVLAML